MERTRWQRLSNALDALLDLDGDARLARLAEIEADDADFARDLRGLLAQVVELRYFAGLSELEIAALLKRSERSIRRDWQKARMFLLASLQDR